MKDGACSLDVALVFWRESHSIWSPCQNSSDCPKKAPKRIDMAGVIERLPWTISLIACEETPMARAIAFGEIPIGLRYSSTRISPGVIGVFIGLWAGAQSGFWFSVSHCVDSKF